MARVDWKDIASKAPDPLPTTIDELDALVRLYRPDLPHDRSRSKQRRNWRNSFVGFVKWERWKLANPHAKCENCANLERHREGLRCELGYESGGWYQPVKADDVCHDWERADA